MTKPTDRTGIEISVSEDSPPLSIRVMRGGRLVHEFHEDTPPTSPDPQAEAEQ